MRVKGVIAGLLAAAACGMVAPPTLARHVPVVRLPGVWSVPPGSRPVPAPPDPATPSPAPTRPFTAVRFSGDEAADATKLNRLAAEGWEYVGPLANGTVAFRRAGAAASDVEGTWQLVSLEQDGKTATPQLVPPVRLTVTGGDWAARSGDSVIQAGTLTTDPTRSPRQVNFFVRHGGAEVVFWSGPAIYRVEAGALAVCLDESAPGIRPTDFATVGHATRLVMRWERVRPAGRQEGDCPNDTGNGR